MKRFLIVVLLFCFIPVARAEMPGASLLKSIPFLNKSDTGKQEQKKDTEETQGKGPSPKESPAASLLKSLPFFNKTRSSDKQADGSGPVQSSPGSPVTGGPAVLPSADSDGGRGGAKVITARTPKEFLAVLPPLPADVCSAGKREKNVYQADLSDFHTALEAEIRRLRRESDKIAAEKEPEMKRNMMARAGISQEDAARMQSSKKMSDEEKRALADKYMQQRTGITMDEAERLEKMDEKAREEWAQAYATRRAATGAYNSPEAKAEQEYSRAAGKKTEAFAQQVRQIQSRESKLRASVEKFEKLEMPKSKAMYGAEITPILDQMAKPCSSGIYVEAEVQECNRLMKLLHAAQDRYCAQYGPVYRDALRDVRENLDSMMPDYSRLDQAQDEQMKLSAGIDQTPVLPGYHALVSIERQVELFDTAYKFNLRDDRE